MLIFRLYPVFFVIVSLILKLPAFSIEIQPVASTISIETKDVKDIAEVQKIEKLLNDLEKYWNGHEIDKVINLYSENFINGDGLGLDAVKKLTEELWEAYPDITTSPVERQIKVYGDYATVFSTDSYKGTSKGKREEVGAKGMLYAHAVGEVFLRRFGPHWKIVSDKTIFEKVSIGYGLGEEVVQENRVRLVVPEQVAGGHTYTATLEFNLPENIKPVASISKELLIYPQIVPEDKFRLVDKSDLERLFIANNISKNELVTATVGLTGSTVQPTLLGLVFLSQRVNVIPVNDKVEEISIIKEPAKAALNTEAGCKEAELNNKKNEQEQAKESETNLDKSGNHN